jgi:hypothetical protein
MKYAHRCRLTCFAGGLLAALALGNLPSRAEATNLYYDFIQAGSGDVLATLELSGLPATHSEVVSLSFSQIGQNLFGYDTVYGGTFGVTTAMFVADGIGGLQGTDPNNHSQILDFNPPDSILMSQFGTETVSLFATPAAGGDGFGISPANGIIDIPIVALGDWSLVVPEPSTMSLVCFGATAVVGWQLGRSRHRKRQ